VNRLGVWSTFPIIRVFEHRRLAVRDVLTRLTANTLSTLPGGMIARLPGSDSCGIYVWRCLVLTLGRAAIRRLGELKVTVVAGPAVFVFDHSCFDWFPEAKSFSFSGKLTTRFWSDGQLVGCRCGFGLLVMVK